MFLGRWRFLEVGLARRVILLLDGVGVCVVVAALGPAHRVGRGVSQPRHGGHGSDGRPGEQSLVFSELPVPLVVYHVHFGRRFVGAEITVPAANDVATTVGVLEIRAFEGMDLSL